MYDPPDYLWAIIIAGPTAITASTCLVGFIADAGWYRTLPWFPIAAGGFLVTLLALSRIPVVARADRAGHG